MTCAYKKDEIRIKTMQQQWLQLKMKFLLGCNLKIVIKWEPLLEGGIKI